MDDQRDDRTGGGMMPRFSLKQLLVSTALVSTGLGAAMWATKNPFALDTSTAMRWIVAIAWFGGGAAAGAGALMPFKLAKLGAGLGLIVQFAILVYATIDV
jgi:hypothetical protein